MAPKKSGLGKGLEALLGESFNEGEILFCDLESLKPNPFQPRKSIDEKAIEELALSIKEKGILQPLLVRPKDGGYEIIVGERRWRAAQRAGLKKVPVIVKEVSDRELLELALIENLQRQDLNPLEEAEAYRTLMEQYGYTQEEIGQRVGKDRSSIANALRLLKLPEEAKEALREGRITRGHAMAILSLRSEKEQLRLLREILKGELSVRESESLSRRLKREGPSSYPELELLLEDLRRRLEAPVKIRYRKGRGRIEIEFFSLDDLERIVGIILKGGKDGED